MFEDLKERQRGFRPKEKARLYVTVAACLVIGALVFGGRGCIEEAPHAAPTAKLTAVPEPTTHPLDVKPLDWAPTINDFFVRIARDAPRGSYPRSFSGEQANG